MTLRINVTYSATDGSLPESVEVEWTEGNPATVSVLAILEQLLHAPGAALAVRREAMADDVPAGPFPSSPTCARENCGHLRYDHADSTGACQVVAAKDGPCRCALYVSATEAPTSADVVGDNCRRLLCGHTRSSHADGLGRCNACRAEDHCRFYVGKDVP